MDEQRGLCNLEPRPHLSELANHVDAQHVLVVDASTVSEAVELLEEVVSRVWGGDIGGPIQGNVQANLKAGWGEHTKQICVSRVLLACLHKYDTSATQSRSHVGRPLRALSTWPYMYSMVLFTIILASLRIMEP